MAGVLEEAAPPTRPPTATLICKPRPRPVGLLDSPRPVPVPNPSWPVPPIPETHIKFSYFPSSNTNTWMAQVMGMWLNISRLNNELLQTASKQPL